MAHSGRWSLQEVESSRQKLGHCGWLVEDDAGLTTLLSHFLATVRSATPQLWGHFNTDPKQQADCQSEHGPSTLLSLEVDYLQHFVTLTENLTHLADLTFFLFFHI